MTAGPSTGKPAVAVFLAGLVLTAIVLITTGGDGPTFAVAFKLGCSVITRLLVS